MGLKLNTQIVYMTLCTPLLPNSSRLTAVMTFYNVYIILTLLAASVRIVLASKKTISENNNISELLRINNRHVENTV